ncbi:epimerase [Wenjunlia vitaminophila]|uniref:Epimerase n=1 Tax=Wenjunlia vitaminophila TaxID=76728 RepID=A0A0T6LV99_WENVI|nr:NAD-dependent epimerase/dehydratase family protein [Wenjunlia vitaminophila]KRV49945.1 epimerase [Wenjunlia vitaminophila]
MPTTPPRWRRAVVTGGAGFVGSHLCTALVEGGTAVVCVDDLCTGSPANVAHLVGRDDFTLVRADVTEPFAVEQPVDLVLHFASPASPADYLRLPLHTLETGSLGTRNALAVAREHGARFVLASTSEVYGDPRQHPQNERYWGHVNPVGPRSVYDEAKRYAEALTTAEATTRGVNAGIVRLFNTYGPRMRARDGRAVPTFIRQALAGEPLTVTGDGRQTRSLTYVDDTVAGVLALAAADLTGPVNIGNPGELSIQELARLVLELTGSRAGIRFVERPTDDPSVRCPDIDLARDKLQWEPRVPARDGLARTIAWFRDHPEDDPRDPPR